MHTFTSVNSKYTIYGPPVDGEPEYIVKFQPMGRAGRYNTDNEELAAKLRSHPSFGKRFMEIGIKAKENPNIVKGIRSSESYPELGKTEAADRLIEFGRLQATLLKKDGTYRRDASEEEVLKYEQLKIELEK